MVGSGRDGDHVAFEPAVGHPFELDVHGHPRLHVLDDRFVQHRDDFHVLEVGKVDQVLPLADGHPRLDHDAAIGLVGVDHEAVVGGADRAEGDLLLQLREPLEHCGSCGAAGS